MHANQQSTWALNQSALDQLQAALAATCTAIWQLENFDHDSTNNPSWTEGLETRDMQDINASLQLLHLTYRTLNRVMNESPDVDPTFVAPILPVVAKLVPQTVDQLDIDTHRDILADMNRRSKTR